MIDIDIDHAWYLSNEAQQTLLHLLGEHFYLPGQGVHHHTCVTRCMGHVLGNLASQDLYGCGTEIDQILQSSGTHKRFSQRSSVERVNGYLKDNHGGRNVRVKGSAKVMTHLMFGIIVITATQLFRLLAKDRQKKNKIVAQCSIYSTTR